MSVWRAQHDVLWAQGSAEARRYRKRIVAQTVVGGTQRGALNEGFSLLAGYLLGRNDAGRQMDLSTPLLQQRRGGDQEPSWTVWMIMPNEGEFSALPKPLGGRVELREEPEMTLATLGFSLLASSRKLARKEEALRRILAQQGAAPVGEPIYAFYSSPLVPPFMRRNEVWLALAASEPEGT